MSTRIRPYEPSDRPELDRLYSEVFGRDPQRHFVRRWDWEFGRSPAVERFGNLVAFRDGQLVAHLGRLATRVAVKDQILPAAFLTDFLADTDRSGILALRLVNRSLRELPLALLFGGAPVTKEIYERLGMRTMPIGETLVRVERPGGMLAAAAYRFLRRRAPPLAGLVRRWIFVLPGAFLVPLAAIRYRWKKKLKTGDYKLVPLDGFDERFDTLCVAMRQHCPASCLRDRSFLEWRYLEAPAGPYLILAAVDADGQLAAASVLSRVAIGPSSCGKFMECLYRDEDALSAIINGSISAFKHWGVDLVLAIGLSRAARARLREVGFRRGGPQRSFGVKANLSSELEGILLDPDQWYISPGDGDEDLEETIGA